MLPLVYAVTDTERSRKGIIFAETYADAVRKIEENSDGIIDLYVTSVSGEDIELSDEMYNRILNDNSF